MYEFSTYDPDGYVDANTRVGDAEREGIAERLRHHHADGRIDVDEFQERLDRCYEAKTAGELRELVADLPGEAHRARRHFGARRFSWLVPLLVAIVAVSAVTGGHGGLLFVFLVFIGARLFFSPRRMWSVRSPRGDVGGRV